MVVMWDLKVPDEGEVIAKIPGSIYAMTHDPSQNILYLGHNNEGVHKIDVGIKKELKSVQLGNHQIFDLQIIDENVWAALSNGEVVVMTKELGILDRQKLSNERVRCIEDFGDEVAISFSDNVVRIFDKRTISQKHELKGHKNSVFAARYHPSGKYLASVGRDAHLKVWDSSCEYVLRESIAGHLYTINDLTFREDGRYFVTASMDKSIKLWDAHNFRLLKVLDKHRHAGHGNSVNKLLWMNYHDLLVTCSDDRSISVWDIKIEE